MQRLSKLTHSVCFNIIISPNSGERNVFNWHSISFRMSRNLKAQGPLNNTTAKMTANAVDLAIWQSSQGNCGDEKAVYVENTAKQWDK